jgi:hypothetical protein
MSDGSRVTKAELLDRIRGTRAAIDQFIAQSSEERMSTPGPEGWAPKDHLVHIAAWEGRLLALLDDRPAWEGLGVSEADADGHDMDHLNDLVYQRSKDRPLSAVLADYRRSHEELLAVLETMSDDDLYRPYSHYRPDDPPYNPNPVFGWIAGNTFEHYEEHLGWMRQLIEGAHDTGSR